MGEPRETAQPPKGGKGSIRGLSCANLCTRAILQKRELPTPHATEKEHEDVCDSVPPTARRSGSLRLGA